jgi:hypothetical protein
MDGPFTESKKIVGGYAIMNAKSREEALAFARRFMEVHPEALADVRGRVRSGAARGGGAAGVLAVFL